MKTKIFILGLILLLFSTGGITQCNLCDILYNSGTIYGNVTNEQENPIEGATVEVSAGYSLILYKVTTDSSGDYLIEHVIFETYHITVSSSPYLYATRILSIGPENSESSFSCSPPEVEEDFILTECE